MSRKLMFGFMKGFIGVFVISLLVLSNYGTARAEDKTDNVDMSAIMSALNGKTITDGETINVNDNLRIECKVTVETISGSAPVSKDSSLSNVAATGSTTKIYNGNCSCYYNNVLVATIKHSLTIINYDSGLVHISSGSLTATPNSSSWTTSTYGYSIANTDGSYSSAIGTAKLTSSSLGKSAFYNCTAAVNPGKEPIFTFVQY